MCQYIRITPQICNHPLGFESYMDNLIVWSWVSHFLALNLLHYLQMGRVKSYNMYLTL